MGNCQAIDNASLLIQQPCGKVDKAYWPVPASYVMKTNPGYHVALLLTTTLYPPSSTTTATDTAPLRVTRIKLLRPTDTLQLGHTYRLVSSQGTVFIYSGSRSVENSYLFLCYFGYLESCGRFFNEILWIFELVEVMKGVWAKKYAKMQKKKQSEAGSGKEVQNSSSNFENISAATRSTLDNKAKLVYLFYFLKF